MCNTEHHRSPVHHRRHRQHGGGGARLATHPSHPVFRNREYPDDDPTLPHLRVHPAIELEKGFLVNFAPSILRVNDFDRKSRKWMCCKLCFTALWRVGSNVKGPVPFRAIFLPLFWSKIISLKIGGNCRFRALGGLIRKKI